MAGINNPTSPEESITPSFQGGGEGNENKTDENAPTDASGKVLGGKDFESNAAKDLNNAENSASKEGGLYNSNGNKSDEKNATESAADAEKNPGGFFRSGTDKKGKAEGKGKKNSKKLAAIGSLASVLTASVFYIGIIGVPMFFIGTFDMNLQFATRFTETPKVLEEQSEYIAAEMSANGEFASNYANDLADNGIYVGQVTASGDFVRTDTYIADIDKLTDIATMGHFQANPTESGQLAFLFDNQVINATDFVATVESNPVMYAAFAKATDISARYYYSDGVQEVYDNASLSRNPFKEWQKTNDHKTNIQSFNEIKDKELDQSSNLTIAGFYTAQAVRENEKGESYTVEEKTNTNASLTNGSNQPADAIIQNAYNTVNDSAKASSLLNTAAFASVPYLAASSFIIVEVPVQQARADGTGPVNELMDILSEKTAITYTDVVTGEQITSEKSVLETTNFAAAISRGTYSEREAKNFSCDAILESTGNSKNSTIVKDTSVTTDGRKKSGIITSLGGSSENNISKASSSVNLAFTQKNSALFASIAGGNRIVMGGRFLSNSIDTKNIGAMASDGNTLQAYNHELKTIAARQAAADRATLSPFDISSPNTFLGNIVHNFANSILRNPSSSSPTTSGLNTIGNLVQSSTKNLLGTAIADGSEDDNLSSMVGDCTTVESASAAGDLFCLAHDTVSIDYMDYDKQKWADAGIGVDSSGNITEKSEFAHFVAFAMDRETTVGVKSADVCETYKKETGSNAFGDFFAKLFGAYESCNGVEGIGTGEDYTLSSENGNSERVKLLSAYARYDKVYSLLSEKKSSVSAFRENFYAKYPRDNSPAGRLARISGMTKEEATIALNYASYLAYLADYDPSTRYAFGAPAVTPLIDFTPTFTNPSSNSPLLALLSQTPTKNNI